MASTHQSRSRKPSTHLKQLEIARKKWREGMKLLGMLDFLEDSDLMDKYRERLWAKVNRLSEVIRELDQTPWRVRKATKKERETFLVDVQQYLKTL